MKVQITAENSSQSLQELFDQDLYHWKLTSMRPVVAYGVGQLKYKRQLKKFRSHSLKAVSQSVSLPHWPPFRVSRC